MKGRLLLAAWLFVIIVAGCSTSTKPAIAGGMPQAQSIYPGASPNLGTHLAHVAAKGDSPTSARSNNVLTAMSSQLLQPSSVWTTDENGKSKTAFNPVDNIIWKGNISNTTGSPQTALFVWSLNGPYGSSTLYSGNLRTGSGTYTWDLSGKIASDCGGTYTFTLRVTFNGSTFSKSTTYSVASPPVCT